MKRLLATFCLFALIHEVSADDWSRWMGPNRNNTWNETGTIDSFPANGPKVVWESPVDTGYAGPAVAQGKVVITDFVTDSNVKIANFERREFDGTERITCLNEEDGKQIWQVEYPVRYTISYPSGPRCTPIIDGKHVYTLGAEGHLFCLELESGKEVWKKEIKKRIQHEIRVVGLFGSSFN